MKEEKEKKTTTKRETTKGRKSTSTAKKTTGTKAKTKTTQSTTKSAAKSTTKKTVKTTSKPKTTTKKPQTKAKPTPEVVLEEQEVLEQKPKTEVVIEKEEVTPLKEEKKSEPVLEDKSVQILSAIAIVLAIILVTVLVVKFFYNAQNVTYSKAWQNKSFLVENEDAALVRCDELPNAILGDSSFIYVTGLGSEEEFNLEKKLSKVIEEKNLKDRFYVYVLNDNCGPISTISSVAGRNLRLPRGVMKTPTVLYYKNGSFVDMTERIDSQIMDVGDFSKLLDMYEIEG